MLQKCVDRVIEVLINLFGFGALAMALLCEFLALNGINTHGIFIAVEPNGFVVETELALFCLGTAFLVGLFAERIKTLTQ